ncbi:MAG: hypothetical protein EOL90_09170 [Spartobacteria bacterium]|nr:hypothetical protein [Spartobacteria bacterium]
MAARRKQSDLERRLKEIERERSELRARIDEVRRWADAVPADYAPRTEPRLRAAAVPESLRRETSARAFLDVEAREAAETPADETSLEFAPGPDGLDVKRVVMPRLQRTDLLRPAIGGSASATRLIEPEHDKFRNYFGSAGLKRVREVRKEQGSQRARAIFMLLMVATLGFILFKMIT